LILCHSFTLSFRLGITKPGDAVPGTQSSRKVQPLLTNHTRQLKLH
jgi:hypothetical protein